MNKIFDAYDNDNAEFKDPKVEAYVEAASERLADFCTENKIDVAGMALIGYQIFNGAYMKNLLSTKSKKR